MHEKQFSFVEFVPYQILRIVNSQFEIQRVFDCMYLHKPSMLSIKHGQSWDVYKHLQELAKWCLSWWFCIDGAIMEMEEALMEKNEELIDKLEHLELDESGNRL